MDAATLDKIDAATKAAAEEKDTRNWCPPSVARQLIDALRAAQRERDSAVEGRAFYVQQFEHERAEVNRLGALVAQVRAALIAGFVPVEAHAMAVHRALPWVVEHAVEHHRWHHDAERVDYVRGLEERVTALEGALPREHLASCSYDASIGGGSNPASDYCNCGAVNRRRLLAATTAPALAPEAPSRRKP